MSTENHWLVKKAETLPLGNIFDPLATRIDQLYIGGIEATVRSPLSLSRAMATIRELMQARESAQQVVENRLAEVVVNRSASGK